MDDFRILVHSLGDYLTDSIGRAHLQHLRIEGEESTAEAEITITLKDDSWESRERVIDQLVEVRRQYLGEVFISYHFIPPQDDEAPRSAKVTEFALV